MKVRDLIENLSQFDGNLEIGGQGHFGELLQIYDVTLTKSGFVSIDIESAGDEPD